MDRNVEADGDADEKEPPDGGDYDYSVEHLRQALWDVYRILGFDTDGNETPRSVVGLIPCVVNAAKEARKEWDYERSQAADLEWAANRGCSHE